MDSVIHLSTISEPSQQYIYITIAIILITKQ